MTDKLLTVQQVAEITTLKRSNIYRLMRAGRFPQAITVGDKSVRWWESKILDYLKSRPDATGTGPGTFPGAKAKAERANA